MAARIASRVSRHSPVWLPSTSERFVVVSTRRPASAGSWRAARVSREGRGWRRYEYILRLPDSANCTSVRGAARGVDTTPAPRPSPSSGHGARTIPREVRALTSRGAGTVPADLRSATWLKDARAQEQSVSTAGTNGARRLWQPREKAKPRAERLRETLSWLDDQFAKGLLTPAKHSEEVRKAREISEKAQPDPSAEVRVA